MSRSNEKDKSGSLDKWKNLLCYLAKDDRDALFTIFSKLNLILIGSPLTEDDSQIEAIDKLVLMLNDLPIQSKRSPKFKSTPVFELKNKIKWLLMECLNVNKSLITILNAGRIRTDIKEELVRDNVQMINFLMSLPVLEVDSSQVEICNWTAAKNKAEQMPNDHSSEGSSTEKPTISALSSISTDKPPEAADKSGSGKVDGKEEQTGKEESGTEKRVEAEDSSDRPTKDTGEASKRSSSDDSRLTPRKRTKAVGLAGINLDKSAELSANRYPVRPNKASGASCCNTFKHDQRILCDGKNCPFVYFHLSCVDLSSASDRWLCPVCQLFE